MIIVRLAGGMGNQMFQYALGRALSLENNTKLGLDTYDLLDRAPRSRFTFRDYDLDLFNIHAEIVMQSSLPWRFRSWGGGRICFYFNKLRRIIFGGKGKERGYLFQKNVLSLGPNAYLDGYWQSHKYFEKYTDIIRNDFTLKLPLPDHIRKLQSEIKADNSVCIHVRRGDYVGNSFHEVVSKDYYDRALKLLAGKTNISHLYIFSDDISWCQSNLSFPYKTMFVGKEYAGDRASGHFELMRSCRHFIIPNSSFAWWAAWLSDSKEKIVIAPKKWFGDSLIDTSHRTPEDWVRL